MGTGAAVITLMISHGATTPNAFNIGIGALGGLGDWLAIGLAFGLAITASIYAIDINEDAYYYMMRNVEINKLKGEVKPFLGDVEKVLGYLKVEADRIIMNLPGTAWQFLPQAVKALKPGGTLHYYEFASDYDTPIERIIETAYPRKVEILGKRKVKSKSPGVWHMGIDARIF